MKAMTQARYGSADVLTLADIDKPAVRDDGVLIGVRAAGVGPDVWHLMTGRPCFVRLMGVGLRKPKARIAGRDVAGIVEAVGKDVTQFRPGDAVFGTCRGAFAEYACARAGSEGSVGGNGVLALKPANLTFEQAACVPTSACTALAGLRDAGGIHAGQSVLIIGASEGVGTFAVQLAKAFEAQVTGVCSTPKGGPRPIHRRRPRDRLCRGSGRSVAPPAKSPRGKPRAETHGAVHGPQSRQRAWLRGSAAALCSSVRTRSGLSSANPEPLAPTPRGESRRRVHGQGTPTGDGAPSQKSGTSALEHDR